MLNMDFSQVVVLQCDALTWQPSPVLGVERKPLAREDVERGHATSIVRYAPSSVFRAHPHPLGEEILVLSGTFCDESGSYPAGTYFRNPPGSSHAPFSPDGCILFVKLHQFCPLDSQSVVSDANLLASLTVGEMTLLHQYETERVSLIRATSWSHLMAAYENEVATELLLIEGEVEYQASRYPALTWLRLPKVNWADLCLQGEVLLWVKQGHF